MEFIKKGLVFVEKNTLEREGKKTLRFVELADPKTYKNEVFLLDDDSKAEFGQGEMVDAVLTVKNKFTSIKLQKAS
ncbi:hypothetical protein [Alkaliphilus oremlandii]|uniref:Uncharacterized protein n=1 Tax=Alkaliphilus oremlandii (strain OhILAs) TaxID=350688 RepID=A8MHT0_ALKOO|nr:hypothetical protein [Alkaliphilus oremlandii]ABW19362.1 hypothetical protein Clos_1822 [Alkaliphilus oremlandii OhILAs]